MHALRKNSSNAKSTTKAIKSMKAKSKASMKVKWRKTSCGGTSSHALDETPSSGKEGRGSGTALHSDESRHVGQVVRAKKTKTNK